MPNQLCLGALSCVAIAVSLVSGASAVQFDDPNFTDEEIRRPDGGQWSGVVGLVFSDDGHRAYAYERGGRVWIIEESDPVITPMIDIRGEVLEWRDYGLLGFVLDPNFVTNGYVYLFYGVDRHYLEHCTEPSSGVGPSICDAGYDPNETIKVTRAVIGRITRYTAVRPAGDADYSHAVTVDYRSRTVLVGETLQTGFPILHQSHGTGHLMFGADGTLLASMGDGASYSSIDIGSASETSYAEGLADGIIAPHENIGAYRAQSLQSLSGKLVRLDPRTGDGVPGNPFYDPAAPRSAKSRVWALGLRNPYRMSLRPGTGSHDPADGNPGTIYLGDVGWSNWEEFNVCNAPGQNFGWPVYEGMAQSAYWTRAPVDPDASAALGCSVRTTDLLKQEAVPSPTFPNPCGGGNIVDYPTFVHARPTLDWHHDNDTPRYPAFAANGSAVGVVIDSPIPGTSQTLVKMDPPGSPLFRGNASTGGVWYTGTDFPLTYHNTYFHADFGGRWIKNIVLDENDRPSFVRPFMSDAGRIVFLTTHPLDGQLYYVGFSGDLRKVVYAPGGNRPPTAAAIATPAFGPSPLSVQFIGDSSSDPEGTSLSYAWDFGDGTPIDHRANPRHTFSVSSGEPTSFTATLTVEDSGSPRQADAIDVLVSVNNSPPVVDITSPLDGSHYSIAGETIYELTAHIDDAEHSSSQLTCAWQTELVHNSHSHFDAVDYNCVTQTLISPLGCGEETYFFRIHLTVTDDAGLQTTARATILPDCRSDDGLIAYWPFDEGSGGIAGDVSGRGHHGTIRGASWTTGRLGHGLRFDGTDDHVVVSDAASLSFAHSDSYSISAWVHVAAPPGAWSGIVSKSRETGPWYGLWISSGNQWVYGGANLRGGPVVAGWHHVVVLQDSAAGQRRIYVDGALENVGTSRDSSGSGDLLIGAARSVNEFFRGVIDEVRIYNRVLNESEIAFFANPSGTTQPPIANAGVDQTVVDLDATGRERVTLDGTGSRDPDGSVVHYHWTENGARLADAAIATVDLSVGTHVISLEVTDNDGRSATDTLTVRVVPPSVGDDGLIAYWPLDENSGAVVNDASGRGHHGAIRGAQWTAGISGGALQFDGLDDFVQVPDAAELSFTRADSYSISAWVRVSELAGAWSGIVTKSRDIRPWYGLWISPGDRWTFGGDNLAGRHVETGWHHVVVLQDVATGQRRIYVDGVLDRVGTPSDSDGPGDLLLGGAAGVNEYFDGVIDEVRIYDRALSDFEIMFFAHEFDDEPDPVNDGLIAYWSFDEGGGRVANDASGHGHHGAIHGAEWSDGVSGTALRFDGRDDLVLVAHASELAFAGSDSYM